ncbi:MAG TPA: TIGR02391 family protein [Oligoflexus sp.]|uniref:TIGR02391 family protein n=1 Tax=Oligoflexus sp. TaxID=1971216 RepID=UPI002D7EA42C|nr:TIGR02391 family protein [Oligoflexus sp.]HET9240518.1 TIGR02391 family protein [Oligoflexus sp.]
MTDAKEETLKMFAERKAAFDSLSHDGTTHAVSERLRVWIKATIEKMREHLVEEEVLRFVPANQLEHFRRVAANSHEEFELHGDLTDHIRDKLRILPESIAAHPEQFLIALKNPTIPSADPYFAMMHPTVVAHAKRRFDYKEYADAVEAALKEVNVRVKEYVKHKTQKESDGTGLMTFAFSLKDPIVVLADLSTQSGRDEQDGYARIFAGSILGIRNPKAHNNLTITPERCIHLLMLASLLMFKLDEANVP